MQRIALSVIVPAYQQAATICEELRHLDTFLRTLNLSYETILVIDGNDDDTLDVVTRGILPPSLRVIFFKNNQGKGVALRYGLSRAHGDRIAFIDAGGDLELTSLKVMLVLQELHGADIVIGSKRHSLSEVSYPVLRRIYSFCYQMLNRILFRLRVRDTQVGMKVFRREVLDAVLPRLLVKRFAFDLELLVVARHLGFRRLAEAPIHLTHRFRSSVSPSAVWFMLIDTLAIFWRLHLLRWYDSIHAPERAQEPIEWTPAPQPHADVSVVDTVPIDIPTAVQSS